MTRPWQLAFGLILTALAGYIDAIGFIRLSGFYTSFMSGNTTQAAVSLAQGRLGQAAMPAVLVAMFLLGSTLGSFVYIVAPARWRTPLLLAYEALLILAALAMGIALPDIGPSAIIMALAMGTQNAVLGSVQGFRAGTTFVTGALFGLGQKIAAALTGTGRPLGWVPDAAVWLALLVGALAGAAAYGASGINALILPAGLAALLAAVAALLTARRPADRR